MSHIPGARMADDFVMHFEVPVGDRKSLADLFGILVEGGAIE